MLEADVTIVRILSLTPSHLHWCSHIMPLCWFGSHSLSSKPTVLYSALCGWGWDSANYTSPLPVSDTAWGIVRTRRGEGTGTFCLLAVPVSISPTMTFHPGAPGFQWVPGSSLLQSSWKQPHGTCSKELAPAE